MNLRLIKSKLCLISSRNILKKKKKTKSRDIKYSSQMLYNLSYLIKEWKTKKMGKGRVSIWDPLILHSVPRPKHDIRNVSVI